MPRGLKSARIAKIKGLYDTAEAVPFQNMIESDFSANYLAQESRALFDSGNQTRLNTAR